MTRKDVANETTKTDDPGARIRVILVRPSHPGNIGAAARAIRTMGLTRLYLVAPHKFPHPDAVAMASGALAVLDEAVVVPTLVEAIADCTLALGCTARHRGVPLPEHSPREAAHRALETSAAGEVALVFGNERTGLENDELMSCHAAVHIPSDPNFSSLNLAQAVQVLAYEVRMAILQASAPDIAEERRTEAIATVDQLEYFFKHLGETLDDIDFHKGRSPVTIMKRLRRLFLRTNLEQREVRILRGIFDDAQRMARLAKEQKETQ